jgi:hypothetical protein
MAPGGQCSIVATNDGGRHWWPEQSGTANGLNGIAFSDTATGWVVGDGGAILATIIGGGHEPPTIARISPMSGPAGTKVTITGRAFGATRGGSRVKFGATAVSTYVSWSATKIVVRVPTCSRTSAVGVTTPFGTSNAVTFTRN